MLENQNKRLILTKLIQQYETLHFCPFHRRRCQRRLVRRQVRGRRCSLQEEVQQGKTSMSYRQ